MADQGPEIPQDRFNQSKEERCRDRTWINPTAPM